MGKSAGDSAEDKVAKVCGLQILGIIKGENHGFWGSDGKGSVCCIVTIWVRILLSCSGPLDRCAPSCVFILLWVSISLLNITNEEGESNHRDKQAQAWQYGGILCDSISIHEKQR